MRACCPLTLVLARFLEQHLDRLLPGRQGAVALNRCSASNVSRLQTDPCAVREVEVHHLPPDAHRQWIRGFLAPRRSAGRRTRSVLGERGTAEQEDQRYLAVVERVQVLRRRDLEVVGALDRQLDLGGPDEPRDHGRRVRPQERPQRVAPLRRLAEELQEVLLLLGRVAPALRLDPDLELSASTWTPTPRSFTTRTRHINVGAAAYGSARTSSTSTAKSLMTRRPPTPRGTAPAGVRRSRRARRGPPGHRRSPST